MYYELELVPGFVGIPVGGFADPGFPAPRISIYEAQQHGWVFLAPDIDHERDVD